MPAVLRELKLMNRKDQQMDTLTMMEKTATDQSPETKGLIEENLEMISPGIYTDADGAMHWVYELNMWKNPTLIFTIWKVLMLAAMVPAAFIFFLSLSDGIASALLLFIKILGGMAGILTVLMVLAYLLVGLWYGGKYCVVFEMDGKFVRHTQIMKQFKKSQILSILVMAAAMTTGSLHTAGAGLLAASKQSMTSVFRNVKKITINEKRHSILINEVFARNQVYAEAEDFQFVCDHIIDRCKEARVVRK